MKKLSLLLCLLGMLMSQAGWSQWSIVQTNAVFNDGTTTFTFSGNNNADGLPSLNGGYLGRYASGATLQLVNGLVRSNVGSSGNFCSATLFYRVYSSCTTTPPAYSQLALPSFSASGTVESYRLAANTSISLLSSLTEPGTYIVDFYFAATGSTSSASSCSNNLADGTTAAPRRAYFEFANADSFTDRNFTAGPVWSGDAGEYEILTSSIASTGATNSYTLRLNATGAGTHYLSTPYSDWGLSHEWAFWMGRNNQTLTGSNQSIIWLFANESNLENTTTIDGYRILLGDDSGNDDFFLQRVVNGVATNIITGSNDIQSGRTDIGVTVRVTKNAAGLWTVTTSTLPASNGTGATALACPISNSATAQGTVTDTTVPVNGNGFYGVVSICSSSGDARTGAEYDNFIQRPVIPFTKVSFASASATVVEGSGSFTLPVQISGAAAGASTSLQVAVTAGDATAISGFSTTTLVYPAGSNATQNVTFTVPENSTCVSNTLTFSIQSITGGSQAQVGNIGTFTLTITDNDLLNTTIFTDDFEPATNNTWIMSPPNSWSESTDFPIFGTSSFRHTNTGAAGLASASKDVGLVDLNGATTTWRVKMGNDFFEPSTSTKFVYFLAASGPDLTGNTVNGYAVGVDQTTGTASSPDLLSLWRVTNGQLVYPAIIQTNFDWNSMTLTMSIEVTRSSDGVWSLRTTNSNNYNLLAPLGTAATDNTYTSFQYIGTRYLFASANSGLYLIDDVELRQEICPSTIYSRASGSSTGALWAYTPTGASVTATPGPYTSVVVQTGHQVDFADNMSMDNLTVETGATANITNRNLRLYGDLQSSGTITIPGSTINLVGSQLQNLSGTDLRLQNVTLNNAVGASLADSLKLSGTLLTQSGVFQTQNKLILLSTAEGDGTIGRIATGADVTGQITLHRFIPTGPSYWVYMGSPLQNQTIANWNDELVTTGFPGSDFPTYSFLSFYSYNESAVGTRNQGWTAPASISDPLLPHTGYIVYMSAASNTVKTTGNFLKGQFSVPLSYTNHTTGLGFNDPDGWNLVTNPYPSYIDWEALDANSSETFDGNYYVYHTPSGNYRVYNANAQSGTASRYIPHSQGFFVQSGGANQSLTFNENVKTATGAAFSRSAEDAQLFRLSIARGNMRDEAVMTFVDGATFDFDATYDAAKWDSPVATAPEIAFVTANQELLSIDARPVLGATMTGLVYVDMPAAGTYTLQVDEWKNISSDLCITLEDLVDGTIYSLSEGTTVNVTVSQPYTGNRFAIRIGTTLSVNSIPVTCHGSQDAAIHVLAAESEVWTWQLANSLGQEVTSGTGTQWIQELSGDTYTLTVQSDQPGCLPQMMSVSISEPAPAMIYEEHQVASCNGQENGKIVGNFEHETYFTYTLTNSAEEILQTGSLFETEWMFDSLSADIYTVHIQSACLDTTFSLSLFDPQAIELQLLLSQETASIVEGQPATVNASTWSTNAQDFVWTVNGEEVAGSSELPLSFQEAGNYVIGVTASNEQCSASATSTVVVSTTVEQTEILVDQTQPTVSIVGQEIVFQFSENHATSKQITIFSSLGQVVVSTTNSAGTRVSLDGSALAKGIYTYSIQSDNTYIATGSFNF